jgi:hypothetical protein
VKLEVTDDSGFLALVDPDAYAGYVAQEWTLDDVIERFQQEMAARHLLIWGTGQEGCWTVEVLPHVHPAAGAREVSGSIVSSRGRLLVTNYESLTMAAQFQDIVLPEAHQRELLFHVSPGSYLCRIVQHRLEAGNWTKGQVPEFSIGLEAVADMAAPWERIPWADDYL